MLSAIVHSVAQQAQLTAQNANKITWCSPQDPNDWSVESSSEQNGESIPQAEIPKDKITQIKEMSERLKAYAERSQTVGGELCQEAAEFIDSVYEGLPASTSPLVSLGYTRNFELPFDEYPKGHLLEIEKMDSLKICQVLLSLGIIKVEQTEDITLNRRTVKVSMSVASTPENKIHPDIVIPMDDVYKPVPSIGVVPNALFTMHGTGYTNPGHASYVDTGPYQEETKPPLDAIGITNKALDALGKTSAYEYAKKIGLFK